MLGLILWSYGWNREHTFYGFYANNLRFGKWVWVCADVCGGGGADDTKQNERKKKRKRNKYHQFNKLWEIFYHRKLSMCMPVSMCVCVNSVVFFVCIWRVHQVFDSLYRTSIHSTILRLLFYIFLTLHTHRAHTHTYCAIHFKIMSHQQFNI